MSKLLKPYSTFVSPGQPPLPSYRWQWWLRRSLIICTLLLLLPLSLAANNPGHDTLYIEEQGDSSLNGSLEVANRLYSDYLDILGNGTILGSANRILGTATDMYIESPYNIIINGLVGTSNMVYLGNDAADNVNLNVTGDVYVKAGKNITIGDLKVCLEDGTNCIGGNNTGNISDVSAGNGISVSGTSDVTVSIDATSCGADEYSYWDGSSWLCRSDESGSSIWTNSSNNATYTVGNVGIGNTTPQSKLVVQGNITPGANNTYTLGTPNNVWRDVYVGPGSLYIGGLSLTNIGGELQWGGSAVVTGATSGDITAVNTNGPYLSGGAETGDVSLLFNETKLNDTIDDRDNDTTYTAGDYLYLTGTEFNLNDTTLNDTIDARDDQTLTEVLSSGNSAGTTSINMNGQDILSANNVQVNGQLSHSSGATVTIDDAVQVNGPGDSVFTGGLNISDDIKVGGNDIYDSTGTAKITFDSGDVIITLG